MTAWCRSPRENTGDFPPTSRGYREGRVPDWNRQMSMRFWFKSRFFCCASDLGRSMISEFLTLTLYKADPKGCWVGQRLHLKSWVLWYAGHCSVSGSIQPIFRLPQRVAFSSWLVTTQSWKCSVTAAYSSGAPVIAIFECQIGETLTFYHERGQKHCKNLHKTAKSQHGWKTVCQKWVVHVDIPPTQTLPFLDPTTQPLGGEGAPPACSPGYTKGLPGQKLQETIFFLPSLYAVSTSIHSVHQGLCVCNMVIRLYIYNMSTVYKKAGTATVYIL